MTRRQHLDAIAELVAAELDAAPRRTARRLLRPQLRWAADRLDEELARELGVLDLVERCRDEHLAALDADDGLAVLGLSWQELAVHADGRLATREAHACRRCGFRFDRGARRCGRCRLRRGGARRAPER